MEEIKNIRRNVEKFNEIYSEDRFKARIFAFENSPSEDSTWYNNVSPGVFQIFGYTKKLGVSKTLKLYVSKKCNFKYIVNKTTFYHHSRGKMMPITLQAVNSDLKDIFIQHFSWVRFLVENSIMDISFNSIVRNKLYSRDKVLRFMYGCSYENAVLLKNNFPYREWKVFRKNIINTENLNKDLFEDKQVLVDTLSLAYKMNENINAGWSARRLKEEHDRLSKEYTDIAFEMTNRPLTIHPIFFDFNNYLGGGLLTDTKQLAIEGSTKKHCVASYSNRVDSGRTAIFNIDGYTAEILNNGKQLHLSQFKGYRNVEAPNDLKERVKKSLSQFNLTKKESDYKYQNDYRSLWTEEVDLPF